MFLKRIAPSSEFEGFNIFAIVIDDLCQAQEYIDNSDLKNQKQITALFNLITVSGLPHNEEKFKTIGDDIFQLKTQRGMRILCFTGGSKLPKSLILTHAFNKPKKKELRREKTRAIELKHQYLNEEIKVLKNF